MNPTLPDTFAGLTLAMGLLSFAVTVALVVAIFMISGATRRTAKAAEEITKQVAEIKAHLLADKA